MLRRSCPTLLGALVALLPGASRLGPGPSFAQGPAGGQSGQSGQAGGKAGATADKAKQDDKAKADAKEREEAKKLTPDQRADKATARLEELKKQAMDLAKEDCPKTQEEWDKWKAKVLELLARLLAAGDLGGDLRKDGASPDKLKAYEKARGSKAERQQEQAQAIAKAIECAQSANPKEVQEAQKDSAKLAQYYLQFKKQVETLKATFILKEKEQLGLSVNVTACEKCEPAKEPPAAGGGTQEKPK